MGLMTMCPSYLSDGIWPSDFIQRSLEAPYRRSIDGAWG